MTHLTGITLLLLLGVGFSMVAIGCREGSREQGLFMAAMASSWLWALILWAV